MRRAWLTGLGIMVVIGAAAWMITLPDWGGPDRSPDPVAVRISKATIVLRDRGVVRAEIAADRVELSADRETTTFTGQPRAVIYLGGVRRMTATGGRMVLNRRTQTVRVEGGLRIVTQQGETISARSAFWDQESQVVDLSGDVGVTFPLRERAP